MTVPLFVFAPSTCKTYTHAGKVRPSRSSARSASASVEDGPQRQIVGVLFFVVVAIDELVGVAAEGANMSHLVLAGLAFARSGIP